MLVATLASPLLACSSGDDPLPPDAMAAPDAMAMPDAAAAIIGGDRPVSVYVPASYDPATPMPLVILLHGFTASGDLQEAYFQITRHAESRGFLYAHPDGTANADGNRFWNATDACCDFEPSGVDDSAYLRQVIDEIKAAYSVDARRVFFIGHSNGGFMSHRMACDHADAVAAIVSLAGAQYADVSRCMPTEPVSVLQIHGTADDLILYAGGANIGNAYPGAMTTVESWAELDGCELTATEGEMPMDLETGIPGAETTALRYETGCNAGGHAELWSITDAGHLPRISADFIPAALDFMYTHPKPE